MIKVTKEIKSKTKGLYQITGVTVFIIFRKNPWPHEITDVTGVTGVTVLSKKEHWKDHGRLLEVHISKHSPFSSQDHGMLTDVHISKHSHEKQALTL